LQRPKKGPNLSFFSFLPCNWVFFFLFCMVLIVVKKRVFLVCFYVCIFECCISIFVPDWDLGSCWYVKMVFLLIFWFEDLGWS
jgi:hypothetical protein